MEWKLSQEAQKFLMYAYFGIVDNDSDKERTEKCAQRAYLDVNRTIKFDNSLKESSGKQGDINNYIKRQFQEKVSELIVCGICDKIMPTNGDRDNFDKEHHLLCWMIIDESAKLKYNDTKILEDKLKYGQAQKWLNMTLKYMWLIGLLDVSFTKYLHVPVDRYIMEAAAGRKRNKGKSTDGIGAFLPGKNGKKMERYSKETALSWSKWIGVEDFDEADKKSDYHGFQYDIRGNLDKSPVKWESPIEWEGDAWIQVAETVKESERKEFGDIIFNF